MKLPDSTLEFFRQLRENNYSEWFHANKDWYQQIRSSMLELTNWWIGQIEIFDSRIKGLEPKDCLFRINRDIRFAADKSPYKTNMGSFMAPGGKKSIHAGYYVHIEPGGSFISGGVYMPQSATLKLLRKEIHATADDLSAIVNNQEFTRIFAIWEQDMLTKAPVGYPKDFEHIYWLRMKHFVAMHTISDEIVISADFSTYVANCFKILFPFNHYFNEIIDHGPDGSATINVF